jgi:hypothetical protein
VSARSIAAFFKNQQTRITADTVLSYLSHLCDAFLLFRASRFAATKHAVSGCPVLSATGSACAGQHTARWTRSALR